MDTWWIDEPHLLGSRNPTLAELEQLHADGFRIIVSLLVEEEQTPGYNVAHATRLGFTRHTIPVKDFHAPTVQQLADFVALTQEMPHGRKAIVHCEGGIGRTGTFAAAYWIAKGMPAARAIAHVRKARPGAIEATAQEEALREFEDKRTHSI